MKNNILFLGEKCSGKTTKFRKLMSEVNANEVIGIDTISSVEEFEIYLAKAQNESKRLIATTSLYQVEIPIPILDKFEIIHGVFMDW
jgi:septin family protein